jgi:dihydrofolate reductase
MTIRNLTFILAMDENNLIGSNNDLPWRLPADLIYFKQKTINKTILMGRKTCESLPFLLPKRRNVVLTRNINFSLFS